jgi:hypothetical protein
LNALYGPQSHRSTARVLLDLGVVGTFGTARQGRELWCMAGKFER